MNAESSVPKAAIYIRVSTEEQWREGYSLPPRNRGCANTVKEKAMRYLIYTRTGVYPQKIFNTDRKCCVFYKMLKQNEWMLYAYLR